MRRLRCLLLRTVSMRRHMRLLLRKVSMRRHRRLLLGKVSMRRHWRLPLGNVDQESERTIKLLARPLGAHFHQRRAAGVLELLVEATRLEQLLLTGRAVEVRLPQLEVLSASERIGPREERRASRENEAEEQSELDVAPYRGQQCRAPELGCLVDTSKIEDGPREKEDERLDARERERGESDCGAWHEHEVVGERGCYLRLAHGEVDNEGDFGHH